MLSLSGGHDARFAEPPDPHLSDGLVGEIVGPLDFHDVRALPPHPRCRF